jgi:hypothetical protein
VLAHFGQSSQGKPAKTLLSVSIKSIPTPTPSSCPLSYCPSRLVPIFLDTFKPSISCTQHQCHPNLHPLPVHLLAPQNPSLRHQNCPARANSTAFPTSSSSSDLKVNLCTNGKAAWARGFIFKSELEFKLGDGHAEPAFVKQ